jgi:hypothetical protein
MKDRAVGNHGEECISQGDGLPKVDATTFARILSGSYDCPSLDDLVGFFWKKRHGQLDAETKSAMHHAESCPTCAAIWRIIEATESGANAAAKLLADRDAGSRVG